MNLFLVEEWEWESETEREEQVFWVFEKCVTRMESWIDTYTHWQKSWFRRIATIGRSHLSIGTTTTITTITTSYDPWDTNKKMSAHLTAMLSYSYLPLFLIPYIPLNLWLKFFSTFITFLYVYICEWKSQWVQGKEWWVLLVFQRFSNIFKQTLVYTLSGSTYIFF